MRFLVIQPHLDDAFFSITETARTWVEDGNEVFLLTVFAGVPPAGAEHHLKYVTLWQEYEAAVERGPFEHYLAYEYFDDAARIDQLMWTDLAATLKRSVNLLKPDVVVAPTGIHHPDHRLTVDSMCEFDMQKVWRYDELPYYVLWPDEAYEVDPARCPECDTHDWPKLEREGCREHLAEKQALCRMFASQTGPSLERTLWVPERVWRPL